MANRKKTGQRPRLEGQPPPVDAAPVAPWPLVDRYATTLGSNVTLQTVSNVFRHAQTGYRQQYVDLLDELLEREPHGFAVLSQRILTVAGGRVEIAPSLCESGTDDEKAAQELAEFVSGIFHSIPDLRQAIAALMWAIYYGVSAAEIAWENDGGTWRPARLHFIHSRRLSYPDPASWALHIWDQGMVRGWGGYDAPTQGVFGIAAEDYPGKFITHAPQLRGDYPTRDGLGRELAYWFVLKSISARGASQYVERFGKPWVIAYHSTQSDGQSRSANETDIKRADEAARALGIGSLAAAVVPDSIKFEIFGPGMQSGRIGITHDKWIDVCNSEVSKVVQGQTFTTEPGKFGSKGTSNVGESNALRLGAYDGACLAETLRRDLVYWIVKLNRPELIRLMPRVVIHVEDEPDANERLELAVKGAAANLPIDADALADEVGLPLVAKPAGDDSPRRMMPLAMMTPADAQALADPEKLAEQQEAAAQAKTAQAEALSKQPKTPAANDDEGDDELPQAAE